MSLTSSLSSARSSLLATGDQSSVVSRNIANANVPLYTRKSVQTLTVPGSGVVVSAIVRAEEPALFRAMINSNSDLAMQKALVDSLDELDATVGDVELDLSPAALLSKLVDGLQTFAGQPQSKLAAEGAVRAARNFSDGLNNAASTIQTVRRDADTAINDSVSRVNTLLTDFKALNDKIISGSKAGDDVTDLLDSRDQILNQLSNEMGIRTLMRDDKDMAVYTDSGVVLFDRIARPVTFERSLSLTSGVPGKTVFVDGVPVTGSNATMPISSGRIAGLVQVRDDISIAYERQLDEIARTAITIFAESDQTGGGNPTVPGLFTYAGAPAMPAAATVTDGLALAIRVSANVDPDQGGDATLLRDGGISNPSSAIYVYNTTGGASYTGRLESLLASLNDTQTYDIDAEIMMSGSFSDYTSASAAWLQEIRKVASETYEYKDTLNKRATESHSKLTGVNLDEEMATMLEIERSYQSTAKLISAVDSMFNALLQAL